MGLYEKERKRHARKRNKVDILPQFMFSLYMVNSRTNDYTVIRQQGTFEFSSYFLIFSLHTTNSYDIMTRVSRYHFLISCAYVVGIFSESLRVHLRFLLLSYLDICQFLLHWLTGECHCSSRKYLNTISVMKLGVTTSRWTRTLSSRRTSFLEATRGPCPDGGITK